MHEVAQTHTSQTESGRKEARYHVVHHSDKGLETHSFRTKRELTKHLKPFRPDTIVAMFKGTKLHATITNEYQII